MATSHQAEGSSEEYTDPFCDECYLKKGCRVQVNAFCQTCNTFMCDGCEMYHTDQETCMKDIILRGKDIPSSQKQRPVCHNQCTSHESQDLDQFCKDHSCLICSECGRRSHRACVKEPVKAVSCKANEQEIENLKTSVSKLKLEMVSSKYHIDSKLRPHLQEQRKMVLKACDSMFDELVAKIEHLRNQFEAEVDALFDKQSKLLSKQMEDIDKRIADFDVAYRCIEKAEKKFELGSENLFIRINSIVADVNQCSDEFTKRLNSFDALNLKFSRNDNLHKYIIKSSSIGSLQISPSNLNVRSRARLEHIIFPQCSNNQHTRKPLKTSKNARIKR